MNNEAIIELLNDIQTSANLSPENINILSGFKSLIERDEYKDDDIEELFQIICGKDINEVTQIIRNQNDQAVTNQSLELIKKFIDDLINARDFFASFIADNYKGTPCIEITKTLKENLSIKGFFQSGELKDYAYEDRLSLYLYDFISEFLFYLSSELHKHNNELDHTLTDSQKHHKTKYIKNVSQSKVIIMQVANYFCKNEIPNFFSTPTTIHFDNKENTKLYFHYFLKYFYIITNFNCYCDYLKYNAYDLLIYFDSCYDGDKNNLDRKFEFIINKTYQLTTLLSEFEVLTNDLNVQPYYIQLMKTINCRDIFKFLDFHQFLIRNIKNVNPQFLRYGCIQAFTNKVYERIIDGGDNTPIQDLIKILIFYNDLKDVGCLRDELTTLMTFRRISTKNPYNKIRIKLISYIKEAKQASLLAVVIFSIIICFLLFISISVIPACAIYTGILMIFNFYLIYNLYCSFKAKDRIDKAIHKADEFNLESSALTISSEQNNINYHKQVSIAGNIGPQKLVK